LVVLNGIRFNGSYYFTAQDDRLTKVNLIAGATDCLGARAAFLKRYGNGAPSTKRDVIAEGRPVLVQEKIEWKGEGIAGTVTYLSVAFDADLKYCQILFEE